MNSARGPEARDAAAQTADAASGRESGDGVQELRATIYSKAERYCFLSFTALRMALKTSGTAPLLAVFTIHFGTAPPGSV